jgi:uncharacterized protein (DUF1501 family)
MTKAAPTSGAFIMATVTHCEEYGMFHRRAFLGKTLQAAGAFVLGNLMLSFPLGRAGVRVAMANPNIGPRGDTFVCIFLRGGADSLSMIVPHADSEYHAQRDSTRIAAPDDLQVDSQQRAINLDGFFGLHPKLAPLQEIYNANDMAFIHATGQPNASHSHFEAMKMVERGVDGLYTGWLGRHLASYETDNQSPLRAISIGKMLPASLSGEVPALAFKSIDKYHLQGNKSQQKADMQALLQSFYQSDDPLSLTANKSFAAMDTFSSIDTKNYQPRGRAYPQTKFGQNMRTVAQLIREDVGVEVACVDKGGWDTHAMQGGAEGNLALKLDDLGQTLLAFYEDIQNEKDNVTLVVMSEFGRRVKENAERGTDHGHGGMMILLGGGIEGGQVYSQWPGLHPDQLDNNRDLQITTDYRDILGELITKRLNNPNVGSVFPNYTVNELGLALPRS